LASRNWRNGGTAAETIGLPNSKRGRDIAARLEPLAESGGICISSIVQESIGNRINVGFQDGGEISVKNIDRPIRIWSWHPGTTPATAQRSIAANPESNVATASIAVLPFTNMSGDPEQEYFSDGIADDIITELSRSRSLFVIARNSRFTYRGRAVDIRQVARELGVRYVLEGSVRRSGRRIRIVARSSTPIPAITSGRALRQVVGRCICSAGRDHACGN
jgi:adenylate cyclase